MTDINWLNYLILMLAGFSVNFLIINEASIYFSKKSYLSKWVICLVVSTLLVILQKYTSYSPIYLLPLSVAGGIEIINSLVDAIKNKKALNVDVDFKQLPAIVDFILEHYQKSQSIELETEKNVSHNAAKQQKSSTSASGKSKGQTSKQNEELSLNMKGKVKGPKIISSNRLYGLQDFLKESQGQNVTLSPYLRSNLESSNSTEKQ